MAQNMIKQLNFLIELSFLNEIINLTLPITTTLEQLPLFSWSQGWSLHTGLIVYKFVIIKTITIQK
jgi:hypothetical protein